MKAQDFRHSISDIHAIWNYIKGGKGRFTIKSLKTGFHHTYRIKSPREVKEGFDEKPLFVYVLMGNDSYAFTGTIWPTKMEYVHSKKSMYFKEDNPVVKVIPWLLRRVKRNEQLPETVAFWHEGYCGRCGRVMTNPESLENRHRSCLCRS